MSEFWKNAALNGMPETVAFAPPVGGPNRRDLYQATGDERFLPENNYKQRRAILERPMQIPNYNPNLYNQLNSPNERQAQEDYAKFLMNKYKGTDKKPTLPEMLILFGTKKHDI